MAGLISVGMKTMCMCSFGAAPAALFQPNPKLQAENSPLADITCTPKPGVCQFGVCAQLTTLAMGVPQPCNPSVPSWIPGDPTVMVGGKPALNNTCTAVCATAGGTISIINPGTVKTQNA